ncbi:hypothetical protein HOY80DRAFT_997300 [Tuber brumale]|nr:hypothetical protein HOY80DRAFT_997300 [Tuber brumale]
MVLAGLDGGLGDIYYFGGYAAGSGDSRLIGLFAYTVLTTSFAVSPSKALLGIGVAPTVMLSTCFFLLSSPAEVEHAAATSNAGDVPPLEESIGWNAIDDLKLGDKLWLLRPRYRGIWHHWLLWC